MRTVSIIVKGKVQGVFYRQSTRDKAIELSVTGEVRNLPNGDVHIIASGEPQSIEALISWCQVGPPKARVAGVEVKELTYQSFSQFNIVRGF